MARRSILASTFALAALAVGGVERASALDPLGFYLGAGAGQTASGLFYLPIPVPLVDLYGKLGYTRVQGSMRFPTQNKSVKLDDNGFTAGAGVQVSLSSWSVRGEYEYIGVNAVRTDMMSISLVKTLF